MQLGGQGNHRSRHTGMGSHGILRGISIANDLRQRPIVANGTGQHIRNLHFFTGIDDAILQFQLFDGLSYGTLQADYIDNVKMIVMPQWPQSLGIDVLPEAATKESCFQIMGCKGIARQQTMTVPAFNQALHGVAAVLIESDGPSNQTIEP